MIELPTILLDGSDVDISWVSIIKAALSDTPHLPTPPAESLQIIIPGGVKGEELYVRLTSAPWREDEKVFAARLYAGPRDTIVLFVPSEPLDEGSRRGWVRKIIYSALLNAFQELKAGKAYGATQEGRQVSLVEVKSLMPPAAFEILFHPDLSNEQIEKSFAALADFYRACGGTGFRVEFEKQDVIVPEAIR